MSSDSMILTVANRLARHPPFDRLNKNLLDRVARGVRIRYLEPDEVVFRSGETPKPEFYVVVKGKVELTQNLDGEKILIDVSDGGDIFGVRALLANRQYLADTQGKDDTLLYVLSKDLLEELIRTASIASSGGTVSRSRNAARPRGMRWPPRCCSRDS